MVKMNTIKINILNDIFTSQYSQNVITTFFIEHKDICFPDDRWTDFTYPILNIWARLLIDNRNTVNADFDMYFMDGPYKINIKTDEFMQLTIHCINFNSDNPCKHVIHCSYSELAHALYNAIIIFGKFAADNEEIKTKYSFIFSDLEKTSRTLKSLF